MRYEIEECRFVATAMIPVRFCSHRWVLGNAAVSVLGGDTPDPSLGEATLNCPHHRLFYDSCHSFLSTVTCGTGDEQATRFTDVRAPN